MLLASHPILLCHPILGSGLVSLPTCPHTTCRLSCLWMFEEFEEFRACLKVPLQTSPSSPLLEVRLSSCHHLSFTGVPERVIAGLQKSDATQRSLPVWHSGNSCKVGPGPNPTRPHCAGAVVVVSASFLSVHQADHLLQLVKGLDRWTLCSGEGAEPLVPHRLCT